jgi:hypothetical protein
VTGVNVVLHVVAEVKQEIVRVDLVVVLSVQVFHLSPVILNLAVSIMMEMGMAILEIKIAQKVVKRIAMMEMQI